MLHTRVYSDTFQQLVIASSLALIKMCVSKKQFFFFYKLCVSSLPLVNM